MRWLFLTLCALLPLTAQAAGLQFITVPGSAGEPLYLDVVTAIAEGLGVGQTPFATMPRLINGRYGLGSKEYLQETTTL